MAKKWTETEEKFLKDNLDKMTDEEFAKKFAVTMRSIESKLRRLSLKRKEKVEIPGKVVTKTKKKPVTRGIVHENIRCRGCLIVDGYTLKEKNCRYCGADLFKGDVL